MINTCAYLKGESENNGLSQILSFSEARGIELSEVFCDPRDGIRSFRRLQDLVKLGLCQRLLLYERDALGEDEWVRCENELFFKRNGVRLKILIPSRTDCRRGLVNAIKTYYSPCHTWEAINGDELPLDAPAAGKRTLPYGYRNENGIIAVDCSAAQNVRELFDNYAAGQSFEQMLEAFNSHDCSADIGYINNLLCSKRYLGEENGTGYRLPGIISRAQWFASLSRRVQKNPSFYVDSGTEQPCIKVVSHSASIGFYRGSPRKNRSGSILIDSDKLERRLELCLRKLARDSVRSFYDGFVLTMRSLCEAELDGARAAQAYAEARLAGLIKQLAEYTCGEAVHKELTAAVDELHTASLRLRRIETELELYSIKEEEVRGFFDRAASLASCHFDEKSFIASAFVLRAAASEDGVALKLVSPSGPDPVSTLIPMEKLI